MCRLYIFFSNLFDPFADVGLSNFFLGVFILGLSLPGQAGMSLDVTLPSHLWLPRKVVCKVKDITNTKLKLNHFSQTWKNTNIVMICKLNDEKHTKRSILISLMSSIRKIIRRIILNQLTDMIEYLNSIPNHQFVLSSIL